MSSVVPNEFIRASSYSPIGAVADIIFYGSITIANNFTARQSLPVVITDIPLNLNRLDDAEAYFALRYLSISTRKSPSFSDKHRAPAYQATVVSIPVGTTPFQTLFNLGNPTFFTHVGFVSGAPANLQLSSIAFQPHNGTPQVSAMTVLNSPFVAAGPQINITNILDPLDGMANFDPNNIGFDFFFTAGNTTGATQSVTVTHYGATYAYDWVQMLIHFRDPRGRLYNVGVFDDRAYSNNYPLGQRISTPIEDPNQTNFGSITFDPLGFNSFFNASYTYDIELAGAVEYLPTRRA